jgi:flagellar hook protein FlgE
LFNLDSTKTNLTAAGFNPTDPNTYHNSTAVTVFDSLGNPHTLQNYFVKTGAGTWDVFNTVDGVSTTVLPAPSAVMTFSGTGVTPTIAPATPSISFAPTTGATSPQAITLDFSGSTQFGSAFSVNTLTQDGYTSGHLAGFNIGKDGKIVGRYTNGQSQTLGQVVLANFPNPNGLQQLGGNSWSESSSSGPALVSTPDTGSLGVLQASATEDSNVDLTAELVNMITAQRVYQANAQTIKTQDQVLQTLVNLR